MLGRRKRNNDHFVVWPFVILALKVFFQYLLIHFIGASVVPNNYNWKIKQINFQQKISIKKISKFIDWNPFFEAWELSGKFPKILEDEVIGKAASDLWKDAQKMLDKIELSFNEPEKSRADDDIPYDNKARKEELADWN